jgi:hypothetical protein
VIPALFLAAETVPTSSLAGVISASAGVFTAIALVITAIGTLIRSRKVESKVDQVHHIVNQQRTDMERYQRALVKTLKAHGIAVPDDQSVEDKAP